MENLTNSHKFGYSIFKVKLENEKQARANEIDDQFKNYKEILKRISQ